MYQCQEGHLFCKECSIKHAETKLGDQDHVSILHNSRCRILMLVRTYCVWTPPAARPSSSKRNSLASFRQSHLSCITD